MLKTMKRTDHTIQRCGTRPPHRRGGEPVAAGWTPLGPWSPRQRGGVPTWVDGAGWRALSSPPTRGCADLQQPGVQAAGSSSPTRGCAADVPRDQPEAAVLPADAGVCRARTGGRPEIHQPPRRRGGVLTMTRTRRRRGGSSPPTRGCAVTAGSNPHPPADLPANAGVSRTSTGGAARRSSPPRRRGGVPLTEFSDRVLSRSSPPTRGCAVLRAHGVSPPSVLPADAGVCRTRSPSPYRATCPPRRRGGEPFTR